MKSSLSGPNASFYEMHSIPISAFMRPISPFPFYFLSLPPPRFLSWDPDFCQYQGGDKRLELQNLTTSDPPPILPKGKLRPREGSDLFPLGQW